jgi:benzylsuccinate CoA-transferase BbsE subunit
MEMELPEKEGLLHGIRILDLANEGAGFCSRILADLGALVIKVEKPEVDSSRKKDPFLRNEPSPEARAFFFCNNANKLGITLDIEKEEGRKLFFKLMETTDVVVETFPPGYLETVRCPFRTMSEVNPGLILASMTGFGQTGPRSKYRSCDLVASAFGGQMYVSGASSTAPLRPYGEQSSYVASLFSAIGILLALIKRRSTGKGEHVDISSQEAVAATLDHVLVRYLFDGIIPKRQGNLSWNRSSFILPCKDGHMHMNIASQWETLVEWMAAEGMAEDLTDEKWKDEDYRKQEVDHIMDVLARWTRTHDVGELFETAQAMRFPWAPVSTPEDVLRSPQLLSRQFFSPVEHPESGGILLCPGLPYKFDSSTPKGMRRAPLLGEDNQRIYCDELGFSEEEIERLTLLKVI